MIRQSLSPRPDWQATVEALGLIWHDGGDRPYWDESACYRFTRAQVDSIERATTELYRLFLAAGEAVVSDPALLARFAIPPAFHEPIREAWEAEPPALNFGRFDLGYDGSGAPKLFEFNCDTPTSLLETAVVQWAWKEECFPALDQFNSLHEALVARWAEIAPDLPSTLHVAHIADRAGEDAVTAAYIRDTAEAAGITTVPILMERVGWHHEAHCFVDEADMRIEAMFKLYPWEWLVQEEFAVPLLHNLERGDLTWIEPVWKMIWSNKAILPVLWDLFPGHPNLLPASFTIPQGDAVAKPLLSREGANVSIRRAGSIVAETAGDYGEEGYIYQSLYRLPEAAPGCFPVLGSWVVDGVAVGMGIREDGLITSNTARFVPHVIDG
ncbi:glutathionylspermidine synthase family protein [uncultured Sphingomonas sp.]|uniref:glutathionylspermidine synthase family protein n=1 Tax=uncultured Sphingomonas sp. TaxID=158754 RepID=UPI0025F03E83|nr:glutathionylspermidine synthase family protein [uncultured Sphingomonas sp.]